MSLPLSPPPSRSSSKLSLHGLRTYPAPPAAPTPPASGTPPSPRSTTSASSQYRYQSLKPTSPASLTSPLPIVETPSNLQSVFSPCSDSESDSDTDSDSESEVPPPQRGYYRRLWATEAPTPAPANPAPAPDNLPKPPIRLGTDNSTWHTSHQESSASTLLHAFKAHDTELFAASTHSWQAHASLADSLPTTSPTLENIKALHAHLSALHATRIEALTARSSPSLTVRTEALEEKRQHRDRLLVATQKAHLRRRSREELVALHSKLKEAEREVEEAESEERAKCLDAVLKERLETDVNDVERFAVALLDIVGVVRARMAPTQTDSNEVLVPGNNGVGRPGEALRRGTFGTPVSAVCVIEGVELEMF